MSPEKAEPDAGTPWGEDPLLGPIRRHQEEETIRGGWRIGRWGIPRHHPDEARVDVYLAAKIEVGSRSVPVIFDEVTSARAAQLGETWPHLCATLLRFAAKPSGVMHEIGRQTMRQVETWRAPDDEEVIGPNISWRGAARALVVADFVLVQSTPDKTPCWELALIDPQDEENIFFVIAELSDCGWVNVVTVVFVPRRDAQASGSRS